MQSRQETVSHLHAMQCRLVDLVVAGEAPLPQRLVIHCRAVCCSHAAVCICHKALQSAPQSQVVPVPACNSHQINISATWTGVTLRDKDRTPGLLLVMQWPFPRSQQWQLGSILHFTLTGQLNVACTGRAMTSELRLQIRTHIDCLESRDLSSQSAYGAEHICSTCTTPQAIEIFLKEVLGGLGHAGTQARRLRFRSGNLFWQISYCRVARNLPIHVCRVAATAFKQHPYERVQGAVPFVVRQVVECVGVEEAAANIEGLAGEL